MNHRLVVVAALVVLTLLGAARLAVADTEPADMGPTGRWPEHTPAYDTPATVSIDNLGQLPAALQNASDGDVIEMAPHVWTQNLTLDAKIDGRVLVRPTLGERGNVVIDKARLTLDGVEGVTFAGFSFDGAGRLRMERASRVAWCWIQWRGDARSVIRGSTDIDLYEHVREEMSTWQGSALHLIRNSGEVGSERVRLVGWWHAGMWRKQGESNQAKDTLQSFHLACGTIRDLLIIDSVLFASSDKMMQNHANQLAGFKVVNTWMNRPDDPWWEVPEGYTTHGSYGHASISGIGADATFDRAVILGNLSEGRAGHSSGQVRNSTIRSTRVISTVLDDAGGNTVDRALNVTTNPPPALPDLDAVWHK